MKIRFRLAFILILILAVGLAVNANAQATRTWVSGVGDDANPCSRTAPCKTFAGAISKTANGGEISVLDPGGYGAVSITKGMTINGMGTLASILSSGVNGVIVNATSADTVTLKWIDINAAGSTLSPNGIRFLAGKTLHVEHCRIWGVKGSPGRGIEVRGTGAVTMNLYVSDTEIADNAGSGIVITPTSGTPTVNAEIVRTIIKQNDGATTSGLFAGDGARVLIRDSYISGHSTVGVDAGGAVVPAIVAIDNSSINRCARGIQVSSGATVRLSRSFIVNNATNGFIINAGTIQTTNDNRFMGNGPNVGALTPAPPI